MFAASVHDGAHRSVQHAVPIGVGMRRSVEVTVDFARGKVHNHLGRRVGVVVKVADVDVAALFDLNHICALLDRDFLPAQPPSVRIFCGVDSFRGFSHPVWNEQRKLLAPGIPDQHDVLTRFQAHTGDVLVPAEAIAQLQGLV